MGMGSQQEAEVRLRQVKKLLEAGVERTPFLIVSLDCVRKSIQQLREVLPQWQIFYSIKALNHPEVLALCRTEGIGFEVASCSELAAALEASGQSPSVISGNPVKSDDFISALARAGVRQVVVDSLGEVARLGSVYPGAKLLGRITVENDGSIYPLDRKFGQPADVSLSILKVAKEAGLEPAGVTFHVGSQCMDPAAYDRALREVFDLYQQMLSSGVMPTVLNAGGGLPATGAYDPPPLQDYADVLSEWAGRFLDLNPNMELQMEPGRFLVGDAGTIVTSVIGRTARLDTWRGESSRNEWLTTDIGVFSGLFEALSDFKYRVSLLRESSSSVMPYHIAGPTCDSVDVWGDSVLLPCDVQIGDVLLLPGTGAYTNCYATSFNGFNLPQVVIVDDALTERTPHSGCSAL